MKKVNVSLYGSSYEIAIGPGLLQQVGGRLRKMGFSGKLVIITNTVVRPLYGDQLKERLVGEGFEVALLEVPDGEDQKLLSVAGDLYYRMSDFHAERNTPVLALGGGVIGDLAGFVAATYMRGVPLVQLPTTLLAQVDSSIGGKVAVNHGQLKNKIGSFYQPRMVITDITALKTLRDKEIKEGLAEVIKYGVIRDALFFRYIEENLERIKAREDAAIEEVVYRSVGIKAEVVERDEKDLGLRNILNFGHTIGHALETVSDFQIPHGEAVAQGMIAAAIISNRMGFFEEKDFLRLREVISKVGLPVRMPHLDLKKMIEAIFYDKKVQSGKVRFVLPRTIGEVLITDKVDMPLVEQVIEELNA